MIWHVGILPYVIIDNNWYLLRYNQYIGYELIRLLDRPTDKHLKISNEHNAKELARILEGEK